MAITQSISQFPAAPQAGTDTPEQFSSKADAFVAHQADSYVGEVNTWATQANNVQTDVNQNATNAGQSETNANNSAIAANTSASNASDSATDAGTSESNAAASEANALQSEQDAQTAETNAAASAAAALVSEGNSATSASDAEAAADSAQASANYTGEWNSGTSYLVGQSVSLSNVFYFCKVPNSNLNPPDNPTEWQESGAVTVYAGLGDVSLAGLSDGDNMYWDNVAGRWKPTRIETIVNANGTAIKYPDGTMICIAADISIVESDTVQGPLWRSNSSDAELNITFAEAFIQPPVVTATIQTGSLVVSLVTVSTTATNVQFMIFTTASNSAITTNYRYHAIGRWK